MTEKENISITSDRAAIRFNAVADLYESVGFGTASVYKEDDEFEAAFFCPGAYGFYALAPDGQLIGMARVFSDNKICSWIAEICVHPSWQKEGVGKRILESIIKKFGHTAIYVDAFAGTESFYIEFGIKPKAKLVACSRAGEVDSTAEPAPFIH